MSDGLSPIPGWYLDPQDPSLARWWDGVSWTDRTRPRPVNAADPVAVSGQPFAATPQPSSTRTRRGRGIVFTTVIVLLVLGGALVAGWHFLRPTWHTARPDTSTASPAVTSVAQACLDTVEALTADGTAGTVISRLRSTANGADLNGGAAFFASIGEQAAPVISGSGAACLAAVAAQQAPTTYATFINEFNKAISGGSTITSAVLAQGGKMTPAQQQELLADAAALETAQQAVAQNAPAIPNAQPAG